MGLERLVGDNNQKKSHVSRLQASSRSRSQSAGRATVSASFQHISDDFNLQNVAPLGIFTPVVAPIGSFNAAELAQSTQGIFFRSFVTVKKCAN